MVNKIFTYNEIKALYPSFEWFKEKDKRFIICMTEDEAIYIIPINENKPLKIVDGFLYWENKEDIK